MGTGVGVREAGYRVGVREAGLRVGVRETGRRFQDTKSCLGDDPAVGSTHSTAVPVHSTALPVPGARDGGPQRSQHGGEMVAVRRRTRPCYGGNHTTIHNCIKFTRPRS